MKDTEAKEKKPYYKVTSLERGLRVVELLARKGELTVTELGRLLGQSRTVAHRFLATLNELGYVTKNESSKYRLTLKLFEIGNQIANVSEIRTIARSYMRELADQFNETVNLGRIEDGNVITIDVVLGKAGLKFDSPIGSSSPAHTLAMGKALLAHLSQEEQRAYLSTVHLESLTPKSITDVETLLQELNTIRENGYAIDDEEWSIGLRCIAAPIFNHASEPVYAISISGPSTRMTFETIDKVREPLIAACRAISQRLGSGNIL